MFKLPDLGYDYDALAPHISKEVMELHHSKHHQAYVDKLNKAIETAPDFSGKSIEEVLTQLDKLPQSIQTAVRNNGGGHYNHSLFWQWMTPGGASQPDGALAESITDTFGNLDGLKEKFNAAAAGVFGSGWAWLLPDMSIVTTPNQDSPLSLHGITPLLGLDVWEHAYYLDYKNKRPDYIEAWWNVVNWDVVSKNYRD